MKTRDLLTARILERINSYAGDAFCNPNKWNCRRWEPCQTFIYVNVCGGNIETKSGKKERNAIDLQNLMLIDKMTSEQLIDYAELVFRRFYIQM